MSGYTNAWHLRRDNQKFLAEYLRTNGPGTIPGDLFAARRGDGEAAERLAERLYRRWHVRALSLEDTALRAQARDKGTTPKRIKLQCLHHAVLLVTQYADRKVFARTEEDDSKHLLIPYNFHIDSYWIWVRQEVPKAARANLLVIEYLPDEKDTRTCNALDKVAVRTRNTLNDATASDHTSGEEDEFPDDLAPDVLRSIELQEQISEVLARSSDVTRSYIIAYLRTGTSDDAARLLGKEPNAGKQIMHRLRKREQAQRTA